MILLFSVEGIESNTEVNFYKGVAIATSCSLEVRAIGKLSKSSTKRTIFQKRLNSAVSSLNVTNPISIFFIGDGDDNDQIEPMNRAIKAAIILLEKFYPDATINKELIMDKSEKMEHILRSLGATTAIINNVKHRSYIRMFDDIAKTGQLWLNDKIDIDKIIKQLNNSNHRIIFLEIKKQLAEK